MSENCVAILTSVEAIFFSYEGGKLRQWITVTIENRSDRLVQGEMSIEAGGEEAFDRLAWVADYARTHGMQQTA